MKVKCELNTYKADFMLDFDNKMIVKDIDHKQLVKLIINGKEIIVDGDELISAINKCQLNCFGR